jgi:hypothetical protein
MTANTTAAAHERILYSTGYLATFTQRSVARVVEIVEGLGHKPAMTLNNIPHYSQRAFDDLIEFVESEHYRTN